MAIGDYIKNLYDEKGFSYQSMRDKNTALGLLANNIELPSMLSTVGKIKGKKLLDVGCGGGIHIHEYLKKQAIVSGVDQSKTMIALAKNKNPLVDLKVAKVEKLPFQKSTFDIVTSSLVVDYIDNLEKAFLEVARVLKKNGLFIFSDRSVFWNSMKSFELDGFHGRGIGYFIDNKSGEVINFGDGVNEYIKKSEWFKGWKNKYHKRTFSTYIQALNKAGFVLIDYIDCKPVSSFKKKFPYEYSVYSNFPVFSIYVCKKK